MGCCKWYSLHWKPAFRSQTPWKSEDKICETQAALLGTKYQCIKEEGRVTSQVGKPEEVETVEII